MPPADVVAQVRAMASRVAGTYGLEIFDVQLRRESSGTVLRQKTASALETARTSAAT